MKVTMTGANTKTAYKTADGNIKRYPARVWALAKSDLVRVTASIVSQTLKRGSIIIRRLLRLRRFRFPGLRLTERLKHRLPARGLYAFAVDQGPNHNLRNLCNLRIIYSFCNLRPISLVFPPDVCTTR